MSYIMDTLIKHTTIAITPAAISSISDFKSLYLSTLKEIYEKKCFFGVYVEEIVDILRCSRPKSDENNVSGNCNVDIQFLLRYSKIERYCVLCFVKVKFIDENKLICSKDDIIAKIEPNAPIFEIGDEIPIIVNKSNYSTNNNIVIIGTSLIKYEHLYRKDVMVRLLPETDSKKEEECKKILDDINKFEEEIKKLKNPLTDYFIDIITPKKSKRKPAGSIKDIKFVKDQVYLFQHDKPFDYNYYFEDAKDVNDEINISDTRLAMLNFYRHDLSNLFALVKNYDSDMFKKHEHIFKLIDKRREKV